MKNLHSLATAPDGGSLVEFLVVIALLGILSAVAIQKFSKIGPSASRAVA
jgi:prepilin-type N-terminal cleavage/methylation domain-containing protein